MHTAHRVLVSLCSQIQSDLPLSNMARTKQTARVLTGGKAPRKQLSSEGDEAYMQLLRESTLDLTQMLTSNPSSITRSYLETITPLLRHSIQERSTGGSMHPQAVKALTALSRAWVSIGASAGEVASTWVTLTVAPPPAAAAKRKEPEPASAPSPALTHYMAVITKLDASQMKTDEYVPVQHFMCVLDARSFSSQAKADAFLYSALLPIYQFSRKDYVTYSGIEESDACPETPATLEDLETEFLQLMEDKNQPPTHSWFVRATMLDLQEEEDDEENEPIAKRSKKTHNSSKA